MSFANTSDILTLQSDYKVTLTNMSGSVYKVTEITNLNVEVDPSSTAVEGTHLSLPMERNMRPLPKTKVMVQFLLIS